jgi:hypothetical protein
VLLKEWVLKNGSNEDMIDAINKTDQQFLDWTNNFRELD